jgi:3-deoxy-7-phosphoheptulonate synthase
MSQCTNTRAVVDNPRFMVVVLERDIPESREQAVRRELQQQGFTVRQIEDGDRTVLAAVGPRVTDPREYEAIDGVEQVLPISKPYKLASREVQRADTVVSVGPIRIGGQRIAVIAGPSVVESREQIMECAALVADSGAVLLRGAAFKPRTSPYAFQGLGLEGLRYLREAGDRHGMPVVSEASSPDHLEAMAELVDVLQIGARNMQNFDLLRRVGALGKPVMLKRGMGARVRDLLMSAEYLLANGAEDVILCERGIRTFETATRSTLDLSAVPAVQALSHLPIIVDPSLGTGDRGRVPPMGLASLAAGAQGLLVEVHPDPERALSDGPQSLHPAQFEKLMRDIDGLAGVLGMEVARLPLGSATSASPRTSEGSGDLPRVAFQGEMGANSEIAIRRFLEHAEPVPCREFRDVFEAVLSGRCRYGALPVENSLTGTIHQNFELLLQFPDLTIVAERNIRIVHNLIGRPGATIAGISRVYSHPQGLAQCRRFLSEHGDWEKVSFYDTAGAVAHLAREGQMSDATIASEEAARTYRMRVLRQGIEDNPQNYTRFLLIAAADHPPLAPPDKASLVFATPDRPGALSECLNVFADHDLNMTKLESRPIPGRPWEYRFYVDVALGTEADSLANAEAELRELTASYRILGVYSS